MKPLNSLITSPMDSSIDYVAVLQMDSVVVLQVEVVIRRVIHFEEVMGAPPQEVLQPEEVEIAILLVLAEAQASHHLVMQD
jgi:hypothetical protein